MSVTSLSRRINEFTGVTLFASALICLVSLATYAVSDAVWFFNSGGDYPPTNFFGQVGSFIAELSYQTLGYASFVIPLALVVTGWSFFWCRPINAAYTKLLGIALLFSSPAALLSLSFGDMENTARSFNAGGYLGSFVSDAVAEYFNRTGSIIVILTGVFLSIILSTQFSFGRLFSRISNSSGTRSRQLYSRVREWIKQKRRSRQRQKVENERLEQAVSSSVHSDTLAEIQASRELETERLKNPHEPKHSQDVDMAGTTEVQTTRIQEPIPSIENSGKSKTPSLPFQSALTELTRPGAYTSQPNSL